MEHHPSDYGDMYEPFEVRPTRLRTIVISIAATGIAAGMMIVAATGFVWSHDWYPVSCCWSPSNAPAGILGDCSEIPTHAVREGPNGYEVTLRPGEHPQVDRPVSFTFPYADAQVSPDGLYHVCLRKTLEPRCFFAGARGS